MNDSLVLRALHPKLGDLCRIISQRNGRQVLVYPSGISIVVMISRKISCFKDRGTKQARGTGSEDRTGTTKNLNQDGLIRGDLFSFIGAKEGGKSKYGPIKACLLSFLRGGMHFGRGDHHISLGGLKGAEESSQIFGLIFYKQLRAGKLLSRLRQGIG